MIIRNDEGRRSRGRAGLWVLLGATIVVALALALGEPVTDKAPQRLAQRWYEEQQAQRIGDETGH